MRAATRAPYAALRPARAVPITNIFIIFFQKNLRDLGNWDFLTPE
jgi:hypothetical protein